MVSKVAVIALVAIVACPILLGYAMNIEETTLVKYEKSGESVNVTPLLQNGIKYTYAKADTYQLNTKTNIGGIDMLPFYELRTSAATSLYFRQFFNTAIEGINYNMYDDNYWGIHIFDSTSTRYLRVQVYTVDINEVETLYGTYNNVILGSYFDQNQTLSLSYNGGTDTMTLTDYQIRLKFIWVGGFNANNSGIAWGAPKSDNPSLYTGYVDLSAGFHFEEVSNACYMNVPTNTKSMIITIDLDSITDSTYSCNIATAGVSLVLYKETSISGDVTWGYYPTNDPDDKTLLYYDNDSSRNVYQFKVEVEKLKEDSSFKYFKTNIQLRFIGGWPDLIGEANYYLTYDYEYEFLKLLSQPDMFVEYINFNSASNNTSPRIRADVAEFRAFEYQVIQNQIYKPSDFKSNPSTTIKDVTFYGTSISFGGHTYTVKNGNIRINSKDIPVDGLELSSILTDAGYENKIGNTVVSTTLTPSTIQFEGSWVANVSTITLAETSYTETEWVAGSFGWDGVDHNFLIVGLIASVGAFIAIAIYARTSNKRLWPALIVCAGAAMMFFAML